MKWRGCFLFFLLSFYFITAARGQLITFSVKNERLEKVFLLIEQQSDHHFIYTTEQIEKAKPVTLSVSNEQLSSVLDKCFSGQPLLYNINEKNITVKEKKVVASERPLRGKILDQDGNPVRGVTVNIKGTPLVVASDANGEFGFDNAPLNVTLILTSVEIELLEWFVGDLSFVEMRVSIKVGVLDETIVKGYYQVSRRLNTGTVDKISAEVIQTQAVSNPLATLQGRIPGLFITQSNGLPGASFSVLLRGRNSLQRGTEPLFVVDGVPFNTERQTQRSQIAANNPFNLINPLDIESIEVLKDAEATAIYGSRGANGVILITTKKGKPGSPKLELDFSTGFGKAQGLADFMNTEEYIAMRREAFRNDGITPSNASAPDLLLWDTTRYTNWKEVLTGGTSRINKAYLKLSGGGEQTSFSFGSTYYDESTVFPGSWGEHRLSFNLNVRHASEDKKLTAQFSSSYSTDKSSLGQGDPTNFINLPPNAPALYDSIGRLNWRKNNGAFSNPMALLLKTYENEAEWYNGDFVIGYKVLPSLTARVNAGYNMQHIKETSLTPIASQDPANSPTGSASFGSNYINNWIIEPQLEYSTRPFKEASITAQIGSSFQHKQIHSTITDADGYTSDALIRSVAGATSSQTTINSSQYRYSGLFGRFSMNWRQRYLLNLTGRRDGSSRFGEGHQFANFGAVAFGWIFTNEDFMRQKPLGLSFGKLRASYGSSGNDQIGDYMYLDTWTTTSFPYQGTAGLRPTRLQNDNYHWEQKSNLELALETGFFQNRLLFNFNYFISRSNDQLINYLLPGQTGFTSIIKNFPALVQNTGVEMSLSYKIFQQSHFSWSSQLNLTFQRNKLLSFPGIEQTSYASTYHVGKPLSLLRGYSYNGINPTTGIYQFNDLNRDGFINTLDQYFIGTRDPQYYGGWQHELSYKHFGLTFFFYFVKQKGTDVLAGSFAGTRTNMPTGLLNRWMKPGDHTIYQRYSTGSALAAASQMRASDAVLVDASYIKLRNVMLTYNLPENICSKLHITRFQFFLQGQNLFTITQYKGGDPESQGLTTLPPLRIINTGIYITF